MTIGPPLERRPDGSYAFRCRVCGLMCIDVADENEPRATAAQPAASDEEKFACAAQHLEAALKRAHSYRLSMNHAWNRIYGGAL